MGDKDSCDGVSSNAVSDRNLESSAVSTGSCPVANPNPDTMTQCFTTQYDNTKDHLDGLTGGAKVFHEYVENCEYGGNNAISSNSLGDLQIAPQIGGTTMFYNNKSASHGLNIYGGDLLVIPSVYFKVINDAQTILKDCGGFSTLLAAMVESGLTQAINDGAKGANHWPTDNAVLMDSQGPGDKDHIDLCLHLWPNVSVQWMHMHVHQDAAWENADSLWNGTNTCTRVHKPSGDWSSLLGDTQSFQKIAQLLECNMGDGQTGRVDNFDKDSCDGVSSNAVSDRNLESSAVSTGSCPVANPNPDTMTQCFTTQYDNTKDHLDGLTGGAKVFHEYVENCEYGGNNAISSNSLGDLQIAPQIGGTTMFYNNKSASHGLNIYGGDLLVIPSVYFKVINDAQTILKDCGGFSTLLAAMVESGLTQAINDGAKGANHWPTDNAVLMDSQGPGDKDHIDLCLHLWPNVSVQWMHMHVYQDAAW